MTEAKSKQIKMLADLIEGAAAGKKVDLHAKPVREVVKLQREGRDVDTVILSMEYSGTLDDGPFQFKKDYSFAEDEAEYALECLLVANNRLQMDYDRLTEGGIAIKPEFFTFQNTFMGLPGDASVRKPALRLQTFIHLAHTGVPIAVSVSLKRPDMMVRQGDVEKKGFGCMAAYEFVTGEGKTTIEKLYTMGAHDDPPEVQAEIRAVATKRLERDCERLKNAGLKVDTPAF